MGDLNKALDIYDQCIDLCKSIKSDNKGKDLTSRQKFAGMLNYADHLIGRLEKALEEAGKRDNTIIL